MASKNAIIKKMKSVETLGSATVVCTDKTGTLTTGVMTVKRLWTPTKWETLKVTGEGYKPVGTFLPVDVEGNEDQYERKEGAFTTALANAVLCCDDKTILKVNSDGEWECIGNMSERPLVVAAQKNGIKREELTRKYKTVSLHPFDSKRKMMSSMVQVEVSNENFFGDAKFIICVKGAPDALLPKCTKMLIQEEGRREEQDLTEKKRKRITDKINEFSDQAFRVLAVAYRTTDTMVLDPTPGDFEKDLVLSGLFASIDPAREGVSNSIETAARAGVRTIMITGDYVKTASAIARDIKLLPENAVPMMYRDCKCIRDAGTLEQKLLELNKEKAKGKKIFPTQCKYSHYLDNAEKKSLHNAWKEIDDITKVTNVFARAKPIDKITIVRSLLRQGHVCSMTGDGVNDAPALKQASIGVAMGITGTDVAKGAADMILVDDNFCSIISAIEEGRTIYANIGKFCYFLLSTNIAEVFVVLIVVILGYPSPLKTTQILWLNLVTDGLPAVALAMEKPEPGTMNEGPKPAKEPLIEKLMMTGIFIQTTVLTTLLIVCYLVTWRWESGQWSANISKDKVDSEGINLIGKVSDTATTVSILAIVFAELLRSYTCRSLRRSVFTLGLFGNCFLQVSFISAVILTLLVTIVPGLQDVFGCVPISSEQWGFVIGVSFIPCVIDEITKFVYRLTGFGLRPNAIYAGQK